MKKTIAFNPFSLPLYLMTKPIGAVCNLNCSYCYYLEKENLYKNRKSYKMSDELLEKFIKEYILAQPTPHVLFTWHGGETLMRSIDFYKKALFFQKRYGTGRTIENVLQTNGILLNEEWCSFFRENNFLIGISIDGPEHCHDIYRKNKTGNGTFLQVMHGIELLQKYQVEFNTLSVIHNYNADFAEEIYLFLKEIGSGYMQFSPIVELFSIHSKKLLSAENHENSKITPWSVSPQQFGRFYVQIFDQWVRNDVGKYFVQQFDATLACQIGQQPGVCIFSERCGHAGVIEFNGDVYSCDHFVFPEHKLGNIYTSPILTMMFSEKQQAFGDAKQEKLPKQCLHCEFLKLCNGECPKNRIATTKEGEKGLNYLCEGYKNYFRHVTPYMQFMANELIHQRPPANVMAWAKSFK